MTSQAGVDSSSSTKSTHMVLILDLTPSRTLETTQEGPTLWLDSAIAFANCHLLLSERNTLTVIGCHVDANRFLYTSEGSKRDITPIDGQHETFLTVSEEIHDGIRKLIRDAKDRISSRTESVSPIEPQLSCALALALCRINSQRKVNDNIINNSNDRSSNNSNTAINTSSIDESNNTARIVILTPARDHPFFLTSQYMNFMNTFFTAQKMDVIIDVTTISTPDEDSRDSILRQACDITGGSYLSIPNYKAMLQYLIWVVLPDVKTRRRFVLPQKIPVGSKAACFCHRNILDVGYVCSVCLSVFCSFSPICSTCSTIFKLGPFPSTTPPSSSSSSKRNSVDNGSGVGRRMRE